MSPPPVHRSSQDTLCRHALERGHRWRRERALVEESSVAGTFLVSPSADAALWPRQIAPNTLELGY
eukprot:13521259-Alexandrium_andersonii.AAC.1